MFRINGQKVAAAFFALPVLSRSYERDLALRRQRPRPMKNQNLAMTCDSLYAAVRAILADKAEIAISDNT